MPVFTPLFRHHPARPGDLSYPSAGRGADLECGQTVRRRFQKKGDTYRLRWALRTGWTVWNPSPLASYAPAHVDDRVWTGNKWCVSLFFLDIHHIVPHAHRRASLVQNQLARIGLDTQGQANLMYMRANSRTGGTTAPHSRIHRNSYYRELTDRLRQVPTGDADRGREVLLSMRRELQALQAEDLDRIFPRAR